MSRTGTKTAEAATVDEPKKRRSQVPVTTIVLLLGAFALGTMALVSPESFDTPASAVGPNIALGDVPLDVTVVPSWTLTNTGTERIELFEPHASVMEGCCPGPLRLGATILEPGESTDLVFPLQMHRGMDGPHEFLVHVPLDPSGTRVLELGVTGDFHN